jgi:hypothetical protein
MRRLIRLVTVASSLAAAALAQGQDPQTKAAQLLNQARAALGDEARLRSLQSLSVSGTLRRAVAGATAEMEIEYDIVLPDKFRRSERRPSFTSMTVIESDDRIVDRVVPTEQPPRAGPDAQALARLRAARRAEFARLTLVWLLAPPHSERVRYAYAGEAEENGVAADVIDVEGEGNFRARLYLDRRTHRPLLLSFRGRKISEVIRAMANVPGGPQEPEPDVSKLPPAEQERVRRERQALREAWRKQFREAAAKAPEVERRLVVGDYKNVGGLNFPHRLARVEDGEVFEEWSITRIKINPRFGAAALEAMESY